MTEITRQTAILDNGGSFSEQPVISLDAQCNNFRCHVAQSKTRIAIDPVLVLLNHFYPPIRVGFALISVIRGLLAFLCDLCVLCGKSRSRIFVRKKRKKNDGLIPVRGVNLSAEAALIGHPD